SIGCLFFLLFFSSFLLEKGLILHVLSESEKEHLLWIQEETEREEKLLNAEIQNNLQKKIAELEMATAALFPLPEKIEPVWLFSLLLTMPFLDHVTIYQGSDSITCSTPHLHQYIDADWEGLPIHFPFPCQLLFPKGALPTLPIKPLISSLPQYPWFISSEKETTVPSSQKALALGWALGAYLPLHPLGIATEDGSHFLLTREVYPDTFSPHGTFLMEKKWNQGGCSLGLPISDLLPWQLKMKGGYGKKEEDYRLIEKNQKVSWNLSSEESAQIHFVLNGVMAEETKRIEAIRERHREIVGEILDLFRWSLMIGLLLSWIALGWIAYRVTRPLQQLSTATQKIMKGDLDLRTPFVKSPLELHLLTEAFHKMVRGLKEKAIIRGILNKVVSKEIAEEAIQGDIELGGEERMVSLLFADIRHFTTLSEAMPPKKVIALINECMGLASEAIDCHQGVIDKYVGDEVMALFSAPLDQKDHAANSLLSAIDILNSLTTWNQKREREGEEKIEMGIGIHTGVVVAGNMGSTERLNYTVLGANVNLASRLCGHAEAMQILLSESTYQALPNSLSQWASPLPPLRLKGFSSPHRVYSFAWRKKEITD
ncbi:MAG: adenylate/guanylate cyclase domain-containing protein, partial [Chlamydiota bacterium]|nr:adenylate/guanylate cyclase domain-containing protein [Chlamydiota bacterium]